MKNSVRLPVIALLMILRSITVSAQNTQVPTVYFKHDADKLDATAISYLTNHLSEFSSAVAIQLSGFTDGDGTDAYNSDLSVRRAKAVEHFLVEHGVDPKKINVSAFGEMKPAGDNSTAQGKSLNRRVELEIIPAATTMIETPVSIPASLTAATEEKIIDPQKSNDVHFGTKGTVVHVPANAFADEHGNIVTADVVLEFCEYRNAADMAFSGLPMTYFQNGEEVRFSSAGMFSLNGKTKNGEKISIRKNSNLIVDYALAKKQDDIAFYHLDADRKWKKAQDIAKIDMDTIQLGTYNDRIIAVEGGGGDSEYHWYWRLFHRKRLFKKRYITIHEWNSNDDTVPVVIDKMSGTLLKGADPGHSYPDIVAGLNVNDFGVYNCDQIYRVPDVIQISATFMDENGKQILNGHILSMIDLNYNGAFSFDPHNAISLSASGKNVLALFTNSGKIYITDADAYKEMNITKTGSYTFVMHDYTATIKTTDDLSAFLGLTP